ncbi:uncharacterized protein [Asterias amurensis]|uniref:uncharacterized protein n=1 Tax=Asterias amurensis TaxID=7602 RepID=UPI003AB33D70
MGTVITKMHSKKAEKHSFPLELHEYGTLLESLNNSETSDREYYRGKTCNELLKRPVYGRICTTDSDGETVKILSSAPGRKTAFIFGPETACGALLAKKPYELLLHLGLLPEYIHLKVCIKKSRYWIILLSETLNTTENPILAATWDGLKQFIQIFYPAALESVLTHWDTIKANPVEFFEREVDFKFISTLSDTSGPQYMSYEKYLSLPKPQTAWQTRLFLYCELRMFELFTGDGLTCRQDGTKGEREYVSTNYDLSQIDRSNWVAVPITVDVPLDVRKQYGSTL